MAVAAETDKDGSVGYLTILARRNFLVLWLAAAVARLGDNLTRVGVYVLALEVGGAQAAAVGWVTVAYVAPWAFGPFSGVLVDRWDKRRTLIACDLVRAALVLGLIFSPSLLLAYGILFLVTLVQTVARPAFAATVPETLEGREQIHAGSLFLHFTDFLMDVLGFAAAAAIVRFVGVQVTFGLNALTYGISALLLLGLALKLAARPRPRGLRGALDDLLGGLRYHAQNPTVLSLLVVMAAAAVALGAVNTLLVVAIKELLGMDPFWFGIFLSIQGVAMTLTTFVIGRYGQRFPKPWIIMPGFLLAGLSVVLLGLNRSPAVAMGLYFLVGVSNAAFFPTSVAWIQQITPLEVRGRVFAFRLSVTLLIMAASAAMAGPLADAVGTGPALVLMGFVGASPGIFGLFLPGIREAAWPICRPAPGAAGADAGPPAASGG